MNEPRPHRKPVIVLIGGAWSAGKSTTAVRLASRLEMANVIHTDVVRACLRQTVEGEAGRCLSLATYETWRCTSRKLSVESLSVGFLRQCRILLPAVSRSLQEALDYGKDTVIEGLHLHPLLWYAIAEEVSALYVWLTYPNGMYANKIRDRCSSTYRNRSTARYLDPERANQIRLLNQLLLNTAQDHHVTILDVTELDPTEALCNILDGKTDTR